MGIAIYKSVEQIYEEIDRMQKHPARFTLKEYATIGEMNRVDFKFSICEKYKKFYKECLADIIPHRGNNDLFNRRTHKPVNKNEICTQFVPIKKDTTEKLPQLVELLEQLAEQ
jgi:hypothetical protein